MKIKCLSVEGAQVIARAINDYAEDENLASWCCDIVTIEKKMIVEEIYINSKLTEWTENTINYEQIIELAYPSLPKPYGLFTVQYSRGHPDKRDGLLIMGESIKTKNRMAIGAVMTNRV